jgi:hypothetical protein
VRKGFLMKRKKGEKIKKSRTCTKKGKGERVKRREKKRREKKRKEKRDERYEEKKMESAEQMETYPCTIFGRLISLA